MKRMPAALEDELHAKTKTPELGRTVKRGGPALYRLRLFVSGQTPRSLQAVSNVKSFCEAHLQGRYFLEVVDIYQQPRLAKDEQIIAAPTLIKYEPSPLRRLIGSMSNTLVLLQQLGFG